MSMLDSPAALVATANGLNDCADAFHAGLMADFNQSAQDADAAAAFSKGKATELQLRDRAGQIIVQAVQGAIDGVQGDQAQLTQAIAEAKATIAKIAKANAVLALVAGLIDLSVAIVTRSPGGIVSSFKAVQKDVASLKAAGGAA